MLLACHKQLVSKRSSSMSAQLRIRLHYLPVCTHIFQERAAQRLIADLGRSILEQMVGLFQHLLGTGIVVRTQDAVAGEIDAQGLISAFEATL